MGGKVVPHVAIRPAGYWADFLKLLTGRQPKAFDGLKIGTRGGLFSPESSDPCVELCEPLEERLNLAQCAATVWCGLIQDSKLSFLK